MIRRYILEGVTVSDGCELIDRLGTPAEAEELESAGRALPPHPPTRPCRWALASHPLGLDEAGRGAVARPCRNLRPCRPAGDALVPGYAGRPWAVTLPLLESVLVDRRHALLDAQAKAGSTGATVAQDLLVEHATSVGTASTPAGGGVPVTPAGGAVDPTCTALWSPEFRAAARAVLSHDVTTTEGRLDAIADGFATDVPLAVRTLCAPTKELSKRHPALALLSDLHGDLGLYFTRITTASVTGAVAPRLKKYTFEGAMGEDGRPPAAGVTFLRQLLDFDLVSMDWLGSPGGLLAYMAARDATSPMAPPPAAEVFTTPAVVAELAPFIHKLLVGMGAADTLAPGQQGYTFLTWAEKYSQHLKLVLTLPSEDEQSLFLDHCHALFLAALRSCGAQLREAVHSLRPQHRALSFPLFTDTEEPTKALLAREKVISQVADLCGTNGKASCHPRGPRPSHRCSDSHAAREQPHVTTTNVVGLLTLTLKMRLLNRSARAWRLRRRGKEELRRSSRWHSIGSTRPTSTPLATSMTWPRSPRNSGSRCLTSAGSSYCLASRELIEQRCAPTGELLGTPPPPTPRTRWPAWTWRPWWRMLLSAVSQLQRSASSSGSRR